MTDKLKESFKNHLTSEKRKHSIESNENGKILDIQEGNEVEESRLPLIS